MRINKYLIECGICSRREADKLIAEGRVSINGLPAEAGAQVEDRDTVSLDGKTVSLKKKKTYLAYYKPRGVVCTADPGEPDNIIRHIGYRERITYAGRLDKDSEGLILMTDDGDLINLLMSASGHHEKEYIVTTDRTVAASQIRKLSAGVHLEEINMDTRPCRVVKTGEREFHITLTQGINRQIRRMCKAVGLGVRRLVRIRIANIQLADLKAGEYRELRKNELEELRRIVMP